MSDFHETYQGYHVIVCASCGKRVRSEMYGQGQAYGAQSAHEAIRRDQGWRLFVSRSRRWYCPNCNPKPGHKMHEVKPR